MTAFTTLRTALKKRADYARTKRAIENLNWTVAVEDLGIVPSDADKLARQAVYG